MSEPDDLPIPVRPRAGCFTIGAAVAFLMALVGVYALVVVLGARGRPATGDVVRMAFSGCDAAEPLVRARVEEMGLGDPHWEDTAEGFAVTARLPDDPASDRIPPTLARTGAFEIRAGENADGERVAGAEVVESAVLRLDLSAAPTTAVQLTPKATRALVKHMRANPTGSVSFWVDGEPAGSQKNDPPERRGHLVLRVDTDDPVERIRVSAARAVVLNNGPLPCPLTVHADVVSSSTP